MGILIRFYSKIFKYRKVACQMHEKCYVSQGLANENSKVKVTFSEKFQILYKFLFSLKSGFTGDLMNGVGNKWTCIFCIPPVHVTCMHPS